MKRLIVLTLILSGVAVAQKARTAGQLMEDCKAMDLTDKTPALEAARWGSCLGFISGWMQAINPSVRITTSNGKANLEIVTLADDVTNAQAQRVFLQYIDRHPELENKPAGPVLDGAMRAASLLILRDGPAIGEVVPTAK